MDSKSNNGQIGCASCSVEAVLSANGSSLLRPKRSQYGDAKKAQEQGCFFIIRSRNGELTVEKQDDVLAYNDNKNSKGLKKTSEMAKEMHVVLMVDIFVSGFKALLERRCCLQWCQW